MSRKWIAVALKATISVLLIWYLLHQVDLAKVLDRARRLDVADAALCCAVLVLQIGLVAVRWWLVARVTETSLRLWAALRILVIGMFFNQTLPSSVGGDAIRVWLVMREGVSLGKAVNVVLCDRVLGLVVLVGLIGVSLPAMYSRIDDVTTRSVLSGLVAGGVVALLVLLTLGKPLARLLHKWRYTRPFGDLAADFRRLFVQPAAMAALVSSSTLVHLLTVSAVLLLAWGIDIHVGFIDCLVIVPAVILVTTLPISIAGWGVREGAMVTGFGFVGVGADDALALSVLYGLSLVITALPGGLVWLVGRRRNERPADVPAESRG
jgi:uncharacterized membrane protein YbhN (UPF0104 family)